MVDDVTEREEVISVFPNRYHKIHTTKSWDYIGLPQTAKRHLKQESDVIIGLLDTGPLIFLVLKLKNMVSTSKGFVNI